MSRFIFLCSAISTCKAATVYFLRHFKSSLTQRETVFGYNDDFVPAAELFLWTKTRSYTM